MHFIHTRSALKTEAQHIFPIVASLSICCLILVCQTVEMVAISFPRRSSFDPSSRMSSLLEQRFLRKHFSPRGILSKQPGAVVALAFIGLVTISILSLNLLAVCATALRTYVRLTQDTNAKYLDANGIPRPILVIAGGAPRTGSTFIFNILRVLMRIRDPNTVASSNWMLAKLVPENNTLTNYDRIALLRTMGTSILIKVHTKKQYYDFVGPSHANTFADEVDLLVTGYRDLREETVSAYKMFAKNRTAYETEDKWAAMCQALIRRRNSLILEAGDRVPVVDIRYEEWREGGSHAVIELIRELSKSIPWTYTEEDVHKTYAEVSRLRVPAGGEVGKRVEWHVSNLMSPKHISAEHLSQELLDKGLRAINKEPQCREWLREKRYI